MNPALPEPLHQALLLLVEGGALGAEEGKLLVNVVEDYSDPCLNLDGWKRELDESEVGEADLLAVRMPIVETAKRLMKSPDLK